MSSCRQITTPLKLRHSHCVKSLRIEVLDTAPVSCLFLKQENYTCGFHHSFLIFEQIWKGGHSIWWIKKPTLTFYFTQWTRMSNHLRDINVPQVSFNTECADGYLIQNTKKSHKFCFGFCIQPACPGVTPWFSFSPLLLFHFLPVNGKTEITLLKSMALWGQSFCVGASGKQEQQWLRHCEI